MYQALAAIAAMALLLNAGCKSSREIRREEPASPGMREFLAKFEPSFNPADYDEDLSVVRLSQKEHVIPLEAMSTVTTALPETIPGFRVQVLFTQDFDQANQVKEEVDRQIPDEWVYIVYDSPYYKVRVGNYTEKGLANPMIRQLHKLGYKDAWVVPDYVLKNIPPKPPEIEIEPENRLGHHQ